MVIRAYIESSRIILHYIYIKALRNAMKNILRENMKRFSTKNLHEQDLDSNNNGYPDDTESAAATQHSGKTIYIVKVGTHIIEKTFNIDTAKETIADHNFDLPRSMEKAKLFKATVK